MLKLLSSTAIALLVAAPVWAAGSEQNTGAQDHGVDDSQNIQMESDSGADMNTGMSADTQTGDETYSDESDTAETGDDQLPDVSESQPGVITGEDVRVDEDQPDAGSGTTD